MRPDSDPYLHAIVHERGVRRLRPVPDVLHPRRHGGGVHAVGPRAPAVPSECACAVWQPRITWLADQLGKCERSSDRMPRKGVARRGSPTVSPHAAALCSLRSADNTGQARGGGAMSCSSNYVVSCRGQGGWSLHERV